MRGHVCAANTPAFTTRSRVGLAGRARLGCGGMFWTRGGVLALLGLAAACRSGGNTPAPVQRITVGTTQEPDGLLPYFSEGAGAHQVLEGGLRFLTRLTPQWELAPEMATRLPTLNNGDVVLLDAAGQPTAQPERAATMKVTWRLRTNAVWGDGTPVTARDMLAGHALVVDPRQPVRDRRVAEKVARMEALDDHTVVVHWKEVHAFFDEYRNHPILPAHRLPAAVDGGPLSLKDHALMRQPLFFGPLLFSAWEPGQFIRLTRNPKAYQPALVDEVVWRFLGSDTAALAALEAGQVDALAPDGTVTPDAADALVARRPGRFVVHVTPGMAWTHIDFNLADGWLKDVRVRRALALAVDRKGAVDRLFAERYAALDAVFPPRHLGHPGGVDAPAFDPLRASALLDEAGFVRGPDGMRRTAANTPLRLELAYATGARAAEQLLQVFQSQWRAAGVDVVLQGLPPKVFFGAFLKEHQIKHLAFYALVMDPSAYGDSFLASSNIPSAANGQQGQNQAGYVDATVDAALAAVPRTLDAAARARLLRDVNTRVMEALPLLPVYVRPLVSVTRTGFVGWAPTGTPTSVSWNIESWRLAQ